MSSVTIKTARGIKVRFGGPNVAGWLPPGAAPPREEETVLNLAIVQNGSSYFLVVESSHPHFCGGDTWYPSLEEALVAAEAEFGIKPADWRSV